MPRFRNWTADAVKKLTDKKSPKKKTENKKQPNQYIILIEGELVKAGIPYTKELKFHPSRRWRFDFAIGNTPQQIDLYKIGIEFNGAVFTQGRHTRGMGYVKDMDKLNNAQLLGYRVLQYTNVHLKKMDDVMTQIKQMMYSTTIKN